MHKGSLKTWLSPDLGWDTHRVRQEYIVQRAKKFSKTA